MASTILINVVIIKHGTMKGDYELYSKASTRTSWSQPNSHRPDLPKESVVNGT